MLEKTKLEQRTNQIEIVRWRNILFDKNGKGRRGVNRWNSLAEAKDAICELEEAIRTRPNNGALYWTIQTADGEFPSPDYRWTIQIPILGE